MNTQTATDSSPRPLRGTAGQAAPSRNLALFAQSALFICGLLCWIGTPKYAKGQFAFTVSPLQAGIPLLGLAALALMLLSYGTSLPRVTRPSSASVWLLLGCGLIFLGAAVHLQGGALGQDTIVYLARWSMPFFFLVLLWFLMSLGGSLSSILHGLIAGAAISALGVILSRAGMNLPTGFSGEGRASGFTAHPNQYGIIASGTAPFLVYYLQSTRRWLQALGWVALGLWGLVLFQALSKTNIILFPVALVLTFLATSLNRTGSFLRSLVLIGVISVALAGLAVIGLELVREIAPREAQTFESAFEDPFHAKSVQQREGAWEEVFSYLKLHPILGLGPGWAEDHLMFTHAHNLYVQAYVDAGLTGFIGIILVTIAVLIRTWKALWAIAGIGDDIDDDDRIQVMAVVALIISLLGNSMSSSLSMGTMTVFVVLLGIAFVRPQPPRQPADDAP